MSSGMAILPLVYDLLSLSLMLGSTFGRCAGSSGGGGGGGGSGSGGSFGTCSLIVEVC